METLKSISSRCECPSSHSEDLVEKAAAFEDSSGAGNQQCYPSEKLTPVYLEQGIFSFNNAVNF